MSPDIPEARRTARGELVMSRDVFRSTDPHTLWLHLRQFPGRVHVRRRQRRIANGTLTPDGTRA